MVAWRPEDAKSISRELTFQADVSDFGFLQDVLLLLCMSVERRASRVGLYGEGVTLKITYGDMRNITRSRMMPCTIFSRASQIPSSCITSSPRA